MLPYKNPEDFELVTSGNTPSMTVRANRERGSLCLLDFGLPYSNGPRLLVMPGRQCQQVKEPFAPSSALGVQRRLEARIGQTIGPSQQGDADRSQSFGRDRKSKVSSDDGTDFRPAELFNCGASRLSAVRQQV